METTIMGYIGVIFGLDLGCFDNLRVIETRLNLNSSPGRVSATRWARSTKAYRGRARVEFCHGV